MQFRDFTQTDWDSFAGAVGACPKIADSLLSHGGAVAVVWDDTQVGVHVFSADGEMLGCWARSTTPSGPFNRTLAHYASSRADAVADQLPLLAVDLEAAGFERVA